MSVPEFLGGLIYGLTAENHLTEIEACWVDGTVVEQDVLIGINDLNHGGWDFEIQAILEFGLAALNLPMMVGDCLHMGPDIKAIESWATIFENPTELIATVTKHYALHRKAIKADIATTKNDWALGEYYKSGVAAADLLTIAVGPIPAPVVADNHADFHLGMPVKAPYEFGLGFAIGFTEANDLTALEQCYTEDKASFKYVKQAFGSFLAGYDVQAVADLVKFAASLPDDLASCKAAKVDVAAIAAWSQIFHDRTALVADITKHFARHPVSIKRDIASVKSDWATGEFYRAGFVAADLVVLAVGPVEVPATANHAELGMPVKAPYEFASGFVYQFTAENNLTAFEACYQVDAASFVYAKQGLANLVEGNTAEAIADFALFGAALPNDVATCKAAKIDLVAVEQWATIFSSANRAALIADVTQHYMFHHKAIKADIHDLKADWALSEYYMAGQVAADLAYVAVGPVE